jgi:hypothetical protein
MSRYTHRDAIREGYSNMVAYSLGRQHGRIPSSPTAVTCGRQIDQQAYDRGYEVGLHEQRQAYRAGLLSAYQ